MCTVNGRWYLWVEFINCKKSILTIYFTGLTNQYFPAYSGTILKQPLFEFSGNQHTCICLGFLREAMNRNCQSSLSHNFCEESEKKYDRCRLSKQIIKLRIQLQMDAVLGDITDVLRFNRVTRFIWYLRSNEKRIDQILEVNRRFSLIYFKMIKDCLNLDNKKYPFAYTHHYFIKSSLGVLY